MTFLSVEWWTSDWKWPYWPFFFTMSISLLTLNCSIFSFTKQRNRKILQFHFTSFSCLSSVGWPVNAHSVAICEGLEDWGATDLSTLSDSEEEDEDQPAPLVRFCYCHMRYAQKLRCGYAENINMLAWWEGLTKAFKILAVIFCLFLCVCMKPTASLRENYEH